MCIPQKCSSCSGFLNVLDDAEKNVADINAMAVQFCGTIGTEVPEDRFDEVADLVAAVKKCSADSRTGLHSSLV